MSDKYQIEVLLRPAVEFYAAIVTFAAAFILWQLPQVLMMPSVVATGCAAFFILLGTYDVWRGCRILRYRRRMSREKPLQINNKRVPVYDDRLYLGEGFEWSQKHTQRYIDTFDNQ
ncbi:MAG: conjugative coupling factor TraD, PFGI-1 class, partial [Pseudomonadota bacterium]